MHRILTIINHAFVIKSKNMVENLEQPSLNETIEFKNSKSSIQEALAHLLSLPHLIALTIVERQVEKELAKQQQANFIVTWSSLAVREARNRFHCNFKADMQADPLGYRGVNLGSTIDRQKQAQQ
jgi:hypothetical protein